jgi:hypothetical protein
MSGAANQWGKQREQESYHAAVLSGDWSYVPISRALCLIKHKNIFKFAFIFLILSCHLCLGPSRNHSLKTIMSIICFQKDLHLSSIVMF